MFLLKYLYFKCKSINNIHILYTKYICKYFSLWVCWYVFSFRTYEDTPAEMLNREDKLRPFENGFVNIYWN